MRTLDVLNVNRQLLDVTLKFDRWHDARDHTAPRSKYIEPFTVDDWDWKLLNQSLAFAWFLVLVGVMVVTLGPVVALQSLPAAAHTVLAYVISSLYALPITCGLAASVGCLLRPRRGMGEAIGWAVRRPHFLVIESLSGIVLGIAAGIIAASLGFLR